MRVSLIIVSAFIDKRVGAVGFAVVGRIVTSHVGGNAGNAYSR